MHCIRLILILFAIFASPVVCQMGKFVHSRTRAESKSTSSISLANLTFFPLRDRSIENQLNTCFFQSIRQLIYDTKSKQNIITVSISNILWMNRINEFVLSYTNITKTVVLVASIDSIVYDYCVAIGIPVVMIPEPKQQNLGIHEAILRGKIEVIHKLLQNGFNVLFAEMDIFLNQNLNLLGGIEDLQKEDDYDMLFSQHDYHPEINMGLFYILSRKEPKKIFQRVVTWLDAPERDFHPKTICGAFDQKILDYAVRGEGQLVDVCKTSTAELNVLFDRSAPKAHWRYIPFTLVPHPPYAVSANHSSFYAIHLWSGQDMLTRYQYAAEHGFWSTKIPCVRSMNASATKYTCRECLVQLGYTTFNTSLC